MNTKRINKILERNQTTSQFYLGCFPADKILEINSEKLTFPQSMVVNFDPTGYDGSHWVAIYADSPKNVDYYDSLGIWPPLNNDITRFLSKFNNVRFNPFAFQHYRAKSCGKHAIFFLYNRSIGKSLEQILRFLSNKKSTLDKIVSNFMDEKIYSIK